MSSQERIDANRKNATKSTGPKTKEGKERSSRNAVKHGMTATRNDLEGHGPGDPTEAYQSRRAEWIDDLKPKGMLEKTLAERLCRAAWKMERGDRYEDATAARRERDAAETHDRDERGRVEAIGRRLIAMRDDANAAKDAKTMEEDPAAMVGELTRTAAGVEWMRARWGELARALKNQGDWDEARKFAAVGLLGLRPESGRENAIVRLIFPVPDDVADGAPQVSVFDNPAVHALLNAADGCQIDREVLVAAVLRLAGRGEDRPLGDSSTALTLQAMIRCERARLSRLKRGLLDARASSDRDGAADRSLFDDARAASLLLRYTTAASRDFHRALADLTRLRKSSEHDSPDGPDSPSDNDPPDGPDMSPRPSCGDDSPVPAGPDAPKVDPEILRNEQS